MQHLSTAQDNKQQKHMAVVEALSRLNNFEMRLDEFTHRVDSFPHPTPDIPGKEEKDTAPTLASVLAETPNTVHRIIDQMEESLTKIEEALF